MRIEQCIGERSGQVAKGIAVVSRNELHGEMSGRRCVRCDVTARRELMTRPQHEVDRINGEIDVNRHRFCSTTTLSNAADPGEALFVVPALRAMRTALRF